MITMTDARVRSVQERRRSSAAGPHGRHRTRASEHEFWIAFYDEGTEAEVVVPDVGEVEGR